MRPPPRRMSGMKVWIIATGPKRLTSSWRRKSAIGWSSRGAGTPMPALFTRPARPRSPTASVTVPAAAAMVFCFVTSTISGVRFVEDRACRASPSCRRRTPAKTWNPISARWSAVAAPVPVDVPVTTTCPRSSGALIGSASREPRRRFLEAGPELLRGRLVELGRRGADVVGERLRNDLRLRVLVDRNDPGRSRRQRVVHLLSDPRLDALPRELAEDGTRRRTDGCRREKRRREEANDQPGATSELCALAPQVVSCFLHGHLALGVLGDEHDPVGLDRPVLDEVQERLEILLRELGDEVDGDQDVQPVVVAHGMPPSGLVAKPALMPTPATLCPTCARSPRAGPFSGVRSVRGEGLRGVLVQRPLILLTQVWSDVEGDLL